MAPIDMAGEADGQSRAVENTGRFGNCWLTALSSVPGYPSKINFFFPLFLFWKGSGFLLLQVELLCLEVELEKGSLLWKRAREFNRLSGIFCEVKCVH